MRKIFKILFAIYIKPLQIWNKQRSDRIPAQNINNSLIEKTKFISDRLEMLQLLPKNGRVAELGVNKGDFSAHILNICRPEKLFLVDHWKRNSKRCDKKRTVEQRFHQAIAHGRVEIVSGLSTEVAGQFEDGYFDWIYIDTDHSYQTTQQELELYRSKVKADGIIAGHDFITGNWNGLVRYGVIEAVYAFCNKYQWEILYITAEIDDHPSFAIRKM